LQNCEKQLLALSNPPVCQRGTTWFPLDRFLWKLIFE